MVEIETDLKITRNKVICYILHIIGLLQRCGSGSSARPVGASTPPPGRRRPTSAPSAAAPLRPGYGPRIQGPSGPGPWIHWSPDWAPGLVSDGPRSYSGYPRNTLWTEAGMGPRTEPALGNRLAGTCSDRIGVCIDGRCCLIGICRPRAEGRSGGWGRGGTPRTGPCTSR